MRRILCALLVLLLCFSLATSAFAADFVPSISYKDHPDVVDPPELVDEDEKKIEELDWPCLKITSVAEAKDTPKAERTDYEKLLLEVYKELRDGTMKLPSDKDKDLVIRELLDATLICGDKHTNPSHVKELAKPGVYLKLTFDLGVKKNTKVVVMTYIDGEWIRVEDVANNGDGTVTCLFEEICPIVFCVEQKSEVPKTGDVAIPKLILWVVVMVVSFVAILVLLLSRRRKSRKSKH